MINSCSRNTANYKASMKTLNKKTSMSKEEFMKFVVKDINLMRIRELQYALYLDFNFPDPSITIQGNSIQFLLQSEGNLKEYLMKNLIKGAKYYLINTEFWNAWREHVGWDRKTGVRVDDLELDVPVEKGHTTKLSSSLVYPDNFEIVPEKMYKAFRRWRRFFIRNPVSRKVICYREEEKLYNPYGLKVADDFKFKEKRGNDIYELELSPYFFFVFKVKDNGEFPKNPQLNFFNKIIGTKQTTMHSSEIYISRYF
jgi:hypothetical protein